MDAVVLEAPWISEPFSVSLFGDLSLNTPSSPVNMDNLLMDDLLKLIGLTEQLMVYLLASRWKGRQDKSVVSISEHVMPCLVLKVRSWIGEPGRLQGSPSASATQRIQLENCSHVHEIFPVKSSSNIREDEFLHRLVPIRSFASLSHACYFKKENQLI